MQPTDPAKGAGTGIEQWRADMPPGGAGARPGGRHLYTWKMGHSESRIRVRYSETDQMGVVYYANYFIWMEVGRVDYCRERGFEYADMEAADGILLTVAESRCRYRAPARFNDQILVRTSVTESRSRTIRFAYEIHRVGDGTGDGVGDGRLLATGETLHTVCDRDGRAVRLPEKYRCYFPLTSLDRQAPSQEHR